MSRTALFLDRDGVINKPIWIDGKIYSPRTLKELELLPGALEAIKEAKKLGFTVIIFTNQPDIARGISKQEDVAEIHRFLSAEAPIDDIFMCPHDTKDNCICRKPKPGMLLAAAEKWGIDLKNSFVVGDRWKDTLAGSRAGCRTFLVNSNNYNDMDKARYDYIVDSLSSAVKILAQLSKQ